MKKAKYISKCCNAEVKMSDPSPDFFGDDPKTMEVGTVSLICSKCGKACNVLEVDFSDVKKVIEKMGKERWKEMKKKEKKKYKIKKTKALIKKLQKYMNEYNKIEGEFSEAMGKLEKKMEREMGIKGIEFFWVDNEMAGIGNVRRTMELINRVELDDE